MESGCRAVQVTGELDLDSSPGLATALALGLQSELQQITVNLARTTFCGCSGLNALLAARANAACQNVRLTVIDVKASIVARVFAITGTDQNLGLTS